MVDGWGKELVGVVGLDGETDGRGRKLFRLLLLTGAARARHRKRRRRHVWHRGVGRLVVLDDRGGRRQSAAVFCRGFWRGRDVRNGGGGVCGCCDSGRQQTLHEPRRRWRQRDGRERTGVHLGPAVVEKRERTEDGRDNRVRLAGQQSLVAGDQSVVHARRAARLERHLLRSGGQLCREHGSVDHR